MNHTLGILRRDGSLSIEELNRRIISKSLNGKLAVDYVKVVAGR